MLTDLNPPPFPLRPPDQPSDPSFAQVDLPEQQPFLDRWRQAEEVGDLGRPGSGDAQLPGGSCKKTGLTPPADCGL